MQEQDKDLLALKALAHGMPTLDWHAKNGRIEAPMVGEARDGRWFRLNVNCGYSEDNAVVARYASAAMRLAPSLISRIEQQAARIAFLEAADPYTAMAAQPTPAVDLSGLTEKVRANMITAFNLGQNYWQQADSESVSQHKKAERTMEKFINLNDETCSLLSAPVVREKSGLHTPMRAVDTRVYLPNGAGGFDVRDCPNPASLANFIARACNAYDEREVLATGKGDAEPVAWMVVGGNGSREYVSCNKSAAEGWLQYAADRKIIPLYATPSTHSQAWEGELPELVLPAPLEIDWPQLNSHALGCGVEDRNIHDRYDAANYGFEDGVDKAVQCVPEEIFDADTVREIATDYARKAIGAAVAGVREQSLEEAAKAVERQYTGLGGPVDDPHPDAVLVNGTVNQCAAAIRSLSSNPVSLTEKVEQQCSDTELDVARWQETGRAVERACKELPEGFDLHIELERNAGTVRLYLPDGDASMDEFDGDTFVDHINAAIDQAVEQAASNGNGEKGGDRG